MLSASTIYNTVLQRFIILSFKVQTLCAPHFCVPTYQTVSYQCLFKQNQTATPLTISICYCVSGKPPLPAVLHRHSIICMHREGNRSHTTSHSVTPFIIIFFFNRAVYYSHYKKAHKLSDKVNMFPPSVLLA